jgi:cytochrome b561
MSVAPQSNPPGYSAIAKSLHWIVALCVLAIVPIGITMGRLTDTDFKNNLFEFHKSLGALVLMLMTIRLIYRLVKGAPPEPKIPAFYRFAGSATHWALYVLLLATPMVAWFGYNAFGAQVPFFGLFQLPTIIGKNEPLADTLFAVHRFLGITVGVLMVMHIGAGLFHYFIRRDGVLQRMLPGS